jgi:hypothetical protein
MLLWAVAIADDPLQALTVIIRQPDADFLSHPRRLRYADSCGNPLTASVH